MCSGGGAYLAGPLPLLAYAAEKPAECHAAAGRHRCHAQNRHEYLLDSNWKFSKGDVPGAAKPDFKDAKWQTVSVPHDWAIAGPFDGNNDLQVGED